ncbi:class I SAM-dependent methyltransferase [Planctomycetota bacterium]
MELKKYWNDRISSKGRYTSIGQVSLPEVINKYRKESLFRNINGALEKLDFSLSGKRVLDAGCGTGIYSEFYLQKGMKVFGIDFSEEAIAKIKEVNMPGHYQVSSLSKIPFDSSFFDLTHCFSVLYHIVDDSEWQKALKELCRVTRKNGLLLLRIEWIDYEKQISFYLKYRSKSKYLKILEFYVEVLDIFDIKDFPIFNPLAKHFPKIYAKIGPFKVHPSQKVLVLRKK